MASKKSPSGDETQNPQPGPPPNPDPVPPVGVPGGASPTIPWPTIPPIIINRAEIKIDGPTQGGPGGIVIPLRELLGGGKVYEKSFTLEREPGAKPDVLGNPTTDRPKVDLPVGRQPRSDPGSLGEKG